MARTDIIGTFLNYEDSQKVVDTYKHKAIITLMLLWKKYKDIQMSNHKWGDESEYHVVNVDSEDKLARYRLYVDKYVNEQIRKLIKENDLPFDVAPEVGNWEMELVPKSPYTALFDPAELFEQLRVRRETFSKVIAKTDYVNTNGMPLVHRAPYKYWLEEESAQALYPPNEEYKLCVDKDTAEKVKTNQWIGSKFSPDILFAPKMRYYSHGKKTNLRRREPVVFDVPIWKDKNSKFEVSEEFPRPGFITLDNVTIDSTAIANLQATFGTKNLSAARYLHDQMHILTPLTYALTAASPIMSGRLLDSDCHYLIWKWFMDGRTKEELDPRNPLYLCKPRNWTAGYYMSERDICKDEYNDVKIRVDEETIAKAKKLAEELGVEIDERMLTHIGYMFVWYVYVTYPEIAESCDPQKDIDCYEAIEANHMPDIRFRVPKSFDSKAGWLIEFRSMEMQPTDEENIAFLMFLRLMSEIIQDDQINMYVPISMVDENMERAMRIDAATKEKFWFRKNLEMKGNDEFGEFTIAEILLGKEGEFEGLVPRLERYIKESHAGEWETYESKLRPLIQIVVDKATGKFPTVANYIRNYVLNHPNYKQDSIVPNEAISELVVNLSDLFFKKKNF